MITVFSSPKVAAWVARRIPHADLIVDDFGPMIAFGVAVDGKPAAGVVWSDYREMKHGADIRVTIAAADPRWCTRSVLRQLFDYPFNTAKATRITAIIREGNHRSLKLCKGLGFRQEGVARRAFNGKSNAIILGMLKEECRWIA